LRNRSEGSDVRREYPDRPLAGVGAVVIREGRVLLVRRGKPPGRGSWAIPGGLVELGETLQKAAEREIAEETGLRIKAGEPAYTFDVVHRDRQGRVQYHYVIVDLKAEYVSGQIRPADDASDARWFAPADLDGIEVSPHTLELLKRLTLI
jgi:8-oxo-dGTP diphosphatase